MVLPFRCTDDDIQWAGLTCTEDEPCPVYLELAAAEFVGDRVFVAGNLHSASVTLYSVLLGSADAGHTWREAHERVRGAGLDHVAFIDPATGWTSGGVLFPLPQDPFFLLTTDGGETWRQQPIFNETQYGTIQQFSFSNRKTGTVVIDRGPGAEGDRYAMYESPDGGATWSIREENSKPIRLKRAAGDTSDVRVRADGETKAFEIEQRRDGRWVTVASFAVKVGSCKPE